MFLYIAPLNGFNILYILNSNFRYNFEKIWSFMNRRILALAMPSIISNISNPLVSSVDTALMGHLNAINLAALGAMGMVFMFIYGTFNFLRSGTTGISAQAYGADNKNLISNTLYRASIVAIILGVALIVLKDYIFDISVYLMNVDNSYLHSSKIYFDIRIYTAPALFLGYVLMGWFFGMQNAIYPLIMTIFLNIVNIIFSYYFVYVKNMDIEGVAIGTLIAQYLALLLGLIMLLKYKNYLKSFSIKKLFIKSQILHLFRVNSDIFIRTLALTFAFAFLYSQAAKVGEDKLAIMVLLLQFIIWFAYSLDGFANAAESLVGKYYGSQDWENFYKAIKYSLAWSLGLSIIYTIIYAILGDSILKLFTNQESLLIQTKEFMPYILAVPIISFLAFIWDGIYIGMTATKAMRNTVVLSLVLYILGFYLSKEYNFIYALWINFLLFLFYRGIIQTVLFYKYRKNLR